jgi:cell division protein FtsN
VADTDNTSPEPNERHGDAERRGGPFSGLVGKVVIPVVVGVLVAIIVALVTPLGDHLREVLFPTSAKVYGSVLFAGQPAAARPAPCL